MTIADGRQAHSNAEKWNIGYPPGVEFAEKHGLTAEQTRIPTTRYTSRDFLARELDLIWRRTWQMVCRTEEIPECGDYMEYTVADQEWLVIRQEDGEVKAFANACRHRGNKIKSGCGGSAELRCQYHHWCWNLDGSLKEIPDRHLFIAIDDEAYSLAEAACDTWAGFVFINPDKEGAPPLTEWLGEVATQLAPFNLDRMRAVTNVSTSISCNWKVAVEAFLEVYHVQGIHPQLMPMIDDVNTAFELLGPHSRMITPFGVPSMRLEDVPDATVYEAFMRQSGSTVVNQDYRAQDGQPGVPEVSFEDQNVREHLIQRTREKGEAMGHDYSGLDDNQMIDDWHYLIFPGLIFNTHAGAFLLFRVRPDTQNPDKCLFDVWRYTWPDENEPIPEPAPTVYLAEGEGSLGLVLDQDFENLPRVQKGLHSDHLENITISGQEVRVAHVHTVVDQFLSGG
ncbi:MAG: aromatic ring-hydroxylating dioxygenase subunit alpha [Actinomycetota bacterium]|nr:aromatic ring-hydroxylating dioxygenase subunit alpha [Actinomycetota bacterium]